MNSKGRRYKLSPWQQKAADIDAEIQKLKQKLLILERAKKNYLMEHFSTISAARFRRKHRLPTE